MEDNINRTLKMRASMRLKNYCDDFKNELYRYNHARWNTVLRYNTDVILRKLYTLKEFCTFSCYFDKYCTYTPQLIGDVSRYESLLDLYNTARGRICDENGLFRCEGPFGSHRCPSADFIAPISQHDLYVFEKWEFDHMIPRSYTTDAAFDALLDVTFRESICRTHQQPNVQISIVGLFKELCCRDNLKFVCPLCHVSNYRPLSSEVRPICKMCPEFALITQIDGQQVELQKNSPPPRPVFDLPTPARSPRNFSI